SKVQALQQSCRQMEAGEWSSRAAPAALLVAEVLGTEVAVALLVIGASLSELKELNCSMTTPEMSKELEVLRKDCGSYTEKLERIKSATNHVTPEEKEKVCSEQQLYHREWRRRKRMATELLEAILEGYPKSKKQFLEEVGIETDEDQGVTLPAA
ncbi:Homologous-pairing protein 2, partial [Calypte anna]